MNTFSFTKCFEILNLINIKIEQLRDGQTICECFGKGKWLFQEKQLLEG